MGSVRSISPKIELERFFDYMYGEEQGYAYSLTKIPDTDHCEQYFFLWPTEKEQLVDHAIKYSFTHEVYFSPGLFSQAHRAEKSDFLGTHFVWVEFDGNAPARADGIPEPTLKIQSSTDKHEHWYWKLDYFIRDIEVIEDITQRIAYGLQADLSCWNANRVLRPPATVHHESARTVSVLRWDHRTYSIESFIDLPALPVKLLHEEDINYVPPILEVIAKYPWPSEEFKFFRENEIPKGHRSSALTKLSHICMELGMSNAETLSVLFHADERWGKFKNRKDRKTRLLGIINFCRNRHPVDQEEKPKSKFEIYNFEEFMNSEITIEWIVPGLIHKKGLISISGPPASGKSSISLRFAEKLAKGESFLKWAAERPVKTLFVSMEMPHEELKYFLDQMKISSNELLRENLIFLPIGSSLRMTNKVSQAELELLINEVQPDGVIFDSLGKGVADDINGEKIIFETFDYIDRLRNTYGIFSWFIHHPRKGQIGNKKPNKLDDLYGNQYIGAALTSAVGLYRNGNEIEVNCLKMRMAEDFLPFKIRRTTGMDFQIIEGTKPTKNTPIFGSNDDLSDSI